MGIKSIKILVYNSINIYNGINKSIKRLFVARVFT